MFSNPGPRRTVVGLAVTALVLALTACAKPSTTPTTGLGTIPAQPTLAGSAGTGQGGAAPGDGTPSPSLAPSLPPGPPSAPPGSPGGGHPTLAPPPTLIHVTPTLVDGDCLGYNPSTLAVVNAGADGYQVTDGSSSMLLLDNATDATTAYLMARNYSLQCFIGRDNTRTGNDRYRYIVEYWKGAGVSGATVPTTDCLAYDNTAVASHPIGPDGWQVTAGSEALLVLDSQADATNAVALARQNQHLCFVGRGNSRPLRAEYIVEYWTH